MPKLSYVQSGIKLVSCTSPGTRRLVTDQRSSVHEPFVVRETNTRNKRILATTISFS